MIIIQTKYSDVLGGIMSIKNSSLLTILCCLFIGFSYDATAQFTQSYLVKEALPSVKKAATDSGWVNPVITAIATIGDTTGLGQAAGLLGGGFDQKTGRSTIWVYIVSITDGTGNPATKLLAYIKVPILGFQQVPLPADAVPGDIPFQPQDSIPTASIINSDAVATAINANESYKEFAKVNPKAKSAFIVLFTSPFDIPDSPFQAGIPLWNFNFADQADSLAPSMTCFVNAITAETFCIENEAPVSVQEDIAQESSIQVLNHPIAHGMNGIITFPAIEEHARFEVIDLFGRTVFTIDGMQSGISSITLPLLTTGVYLARLNQEGNYSTIRFIQQ